MRNSKKHQQLESVNRAVLEELKSPPTTVMVVRVEEAEMDEMWSFVQSKRQQRWLWHAIDHCTGTVLAYVLAPHQDAALSKLMQLLNPFGIEQFYTDSWGAYLRLLEPEQGHVLASQKPDWRLLWVIAIGSDRHKTRFPLIRD